MTLKRLQLDGRVKLVGPRSDRFEIVGMGDRVEVRCDRLRSLRNIALLSDIFRGLVGRMTLVSSTRQLPAVMLLVRGHRVAEFSALRVTHLITARHSFGRSVVVLPAIRFAGLLKSVVNRRGKPPDQSDGKQSDS